MRRKLISIIFVVLLGISLVGCHKKQNDVTILPNNTETSIQESSGTETNKEPSPTDTNKENETQINDKITYIHDSPYLIVENAIPVYSGEHQCTTINKANTDIKVLDDVKCVNYQDYVTYCSKFGVSQKYNNDNQNYLIIAYATHITKSSNVIVSDVIFQDDGKIFVCTRETTDYNNVSGNLNGYMIIIPVEKNIQNPTIIKTIVLTKEESKIFGDIQ